MSPDEVLARLRALADPSRLPGMARYGIATEHAYGVTVRELRALAKEIGRDRDLAGRLWGSGVHEARILASLLDDPALVDDAQFESWAAGFDSWDLCDQVCQNLFRRSPPAWDKAVVWAARPEALVKRAGFVLMAGIAVADERADDERLEPFLRAVADHADDDRPLVRKGASWALRQMGKRSPGLHTRAVGTARDLRWGGRGARWVATDVLRELERRTPQGRRSRATAVRRPLPGEWAPARR